MDMTRCNGMIEATRLTREGRLTEATALLQRLLGQEPPFVDAPGTTPPSATARVQPHLRIIDATPEADDAPPARGTGAAADTRPPTPDNPAQRASARRRSRAREPVPDGATFEAGSFSSAGGSRGYKLYVPSTYRGRPVPLVVMLHGCTQSPDDFAAGTRMNVLAEEHAVLVAYPAQPSAANANRCWNWFSPDHQRRGEGEPALIAGITRQIMLDRAVDPRRVYVAGLSAGGAAAAVMAAAYPDIYAAVGVHSGLACGAARDIPSAFAAMRQGGGSAPAARVPGHVVPTIVFHADRDTTVHPSNGAAVMAQAGAAGLQATTERGQTDGGLAYSRILHADARGGPTLLEQWIVHGGGHAWSGGSPAGSYTDPRGPDASREMLRFFLSHAQPHPAPGA
jgi:poly(hydroxyalkanoate) depolymerase family esterase